MSKRWLMVTSVLAACGGGGGAGPDGAMPDAPTSPITITGRGDTPLLAMVRDGRGPWAPMTADGSGDYHVEVTSTYEWIVVCGGPDDHHVVMGGAHVSNGRQSVGCYADGAPAQTVAVSGTMVQAGTVELVDAAMSTTPNWTFSLPTPTGTQDLFAYDGAKLAIRRGLSISDATVVPDVDLSTEGVNFAPHVVTVDNLGADALATELTLFTAHGAAFIDGTLPTIHVPAPAQLVSGDGMFLEVDGVGANTIRRATSFGSIEDDYPLPDALTGVTFDGATATAWGPLPPGYLALSVFAASATGSEAFEVTPDWVVVTGATQLAIDTSEVPGFDPAWSVDTTGPFTRELFADVDAGAVFQQSVFSDAVGGGAPAARLRARAGLRMRARR